MIQLHIKFYRGLSKRSAAGLRLSQSLKKWEYRRFLDSPTGVVSLAFVIVIPKGVSLSVFSAVIILM